MTNETKKPIQQFKEGRTTIKIWEHEVDGKHYLSVSIGKLYKDKKSDEWRETRSFNPNELQKLQSILPEAMEELVKWQSYYEEINRQNAPETETNKTEHNDDKIAARNAALSSADLSPV